MGRFGVGWQLGLRSWSLLRRDKELLWLPVLSMVAVLGLAVVFGVPVLLISRGGHGVGVGGAILIALLLVGANFVATFSAAAVVAGALERLNGGDPTLRSSFFTAWQRRWPIFQWALLSTVVSLLINALEERLGALGRVGGFFLDVAWAVATAFALPVIIVYGTGPVVSLRQSAAIVKARWGDAVGTYAGASVVFLPVYLVGFVVCLLLAAVSPAAAIGLGVVLLLVVSVFAACVSGIARAAMYQYATTGSSPLLDPALASAAFQRRRRSRGFGGGLGGGFGGNGGGFSGRGL